MPSGSRPRVSVIIPAYNAEGFLADAVRSVLDQTLRDLELVIVNDGSTDGTRSIAQEFVETDARVSFLDEPNGGPSSARNTGIASASGDAICFLDADDIFMPDKLERQVAFLEQFPGCDLVFSDYYVGNDELTPVWLESVRPATENMREYLLYRNRFAPMCPLVRSGLVAATGGFDESLRGGEDWDYWIRAAQLGRLCYLPGPVGVYRTHPEQAHHDHRMMSASARRIARKNFVPGSREWRISLASRAWAEGREAWWDRKLHLIPLRLAQAAVAARSVRILRDVIRWA